MLVPRPSSQSSAWASRLCPRRRIPTSGPHLADFLPPLTALPRNATACGAVKTRPLKRSKARPLFAPLPPLHTPHPHPRSPSPPYPSPLLPLAVPQKARDGPVLVSEGSSGKADRRENLVSSHPASAATHRNLVSSRRGEGAKTVRNEDNNKPKKCSQRPGALEPTPSLSETGARLVGEGGRLNSQAGPRDRLHGARRRSRGRSKKKKRKIHCKARGRRRRAVAMRGVWILLEHMKWKKGTDGGGCVGGGKKIKREDRCSRILCCTTATQEEIQGSVCILPGSCKKKKKNQSQ